MPPAATACPDIQTWQQTLPHGITLSCRACGNVGRPVLLFLHGFPEGAWVWDPLLRHFSQPENGGYRCVAPNLRGYERSSAPQDVKAYRAKHLVQDVLALIDAECGNAALAGLIAHDWGGAVAWSLANQHPTRLRQLVIVNSPHPGPFLAALQNDPAQQAASAYMNFLVQPEAAALLAANDFERLFGFLTGHDASLQSLTRQSFADSASPDKGTSTSTSQATGPDTHTHDNAATQTGTGTGTGTDTGTGPQVHPHTTWLTPAVKAQYRAVWQHGLQGGLNYYCASPLRPATATDPGARAVLIPPEALRIEVPTLVLWAQDDVALLPVLTEGLGEHVPHLQLVPIAQATHWVVHEQPLRVIADITAFLHPPTA